MVVSFLGLDFMVGTERFTAWFERGRYSDSFCNFSDLLDGSTAAGRFLRPPVVQSFSFCIKFIWLPFRKIRHLFLPDSNCIPEGEVALVFKESLKYVESYTSMGGDRGLTRPE